jgi:hypothetical protein
LFPYFSCKHLSIPQFEHAVSLSVCGYDVQTFISIPKQTGDSSETVVNAAVTCVMRCCRG